MSGAHGCGRRCAGLGWAVSSCPRKSLRKARIPEREGRSGDERRATSESHVVRAHGETRTCQDAGGERVSKARRCLFRDPTGRVVTAAAGAKRQLSESVLSPPLGRSHGVRSHPPPPPPHRLPATYRTRSQLFLRSDAGGGGPAPSSESREVFQMWSALRHSKTAPGLSDLLFRQRVRGSRAPSSRVTRDGGGGGRQIGRSRDEGG